MQDAIVLVNKWVHLLSIIGVLGGVMYAVWQLPDEEEPWRKWLKLQVALWVLALLTGFVNFMFVNGTVTGTYQMLFGMKSMLAILMLLVTISLALNEKMFARRIMLAKMLLVFGICIIGISASMNLGRVKGTMKMVATPPPAASPVVQTPAP